ncbi:MAG: VanZ family protein [Anaerolineales bacterium]|nr:VanZ family protein [Anaerolineales bacterium]
MNKFLSIVPRWVPAFFLMVVIFLFSSQSGDELPNFLGWDYFIKKSSHAIGYGLLALSYLHFFQYDKKRYWLAWLMAVAYSTTDEFHQSFVVGRSASVYDVVVFDNLGALILLWLHFNFWRKDEKENNQT